MDSMLIWIVMFAGAAIALLAVFLVASEKELKRKNDELDVLMQQYDEILVRIIDANFEINEKSMVIGELCQELKNMNKSNDNCPP